LFSPDDETLISSSLDGTIRFWNIATSDEMISINTDEGGVTDFALTYDNSYLISGSENGAITTWNIANCKIIQKVARSKSAVNAIVMLEGQNIYVSGHLDGSINFWSGDHPRYLDTIHCEQIPVLSLNSYPGSLLVAAIFSDGSLRVFDTANRTMVFGINLPVKPPFIFNEPLKRVIKHNLKINKVRNGYNHESPDIRLKTIKREFVDYKLEKTGKFSSVVDSKLAIKERKSSFKWESVEVILRNIFSSGHLFEEIRLTQTKKGSGVPFINLEIPALNSPNGEITPPCYVNTQEIDINVNFFLSTEPVPQRNNVFHSDLRIRESDKAQFIKIVCIKCELLLDTIPLKSEIIASINKTGENCEDKMIDLRNFHSFDLFTETFINRDLSVCYNELIVDIDRFGYPYFESVVKEETLIALGILEVQKFDGSLMLIGGKPIENLPTTDDKRFFTRPPTVLIPLGEDETTSSWSLIIEGTGTNKILDSFFLEKNLVIDRTSKYAALDLEEVIDISDSTASNYTIKIIKGKSRSGLYSVEFSIVPELSFIIKPDIIGPVKKANEYRQLVIDVIGPDQIKPPAAVTSDGRLRYDQLIGPDNFSLYLKQDITLVYQDVKSSVKTHIPLTLVPPFIIYSIGFKNQETSSNYKEMKFNVETIPKKLLAASDNTISITVYFPASEKKPYSLLVERNRESIDEFFSGSDVKKTFVIDLNKYHGFLNELLVEYSFSLSFNRTNKQKKILLIIISDK